VRRILYIQYTNPAGYPPLQHSSRILADDGWHVLFLGTGAHGANALRFPPHPNITVRQMPFCSAGWRQKLHYLRYALWVFYWTLRWRPRWIYASDPLICPIARLLSYLPGIRLIYHEHDSPTPVPSPGTQTLGKLPKQSRFQRLVLRSRKALARRAKLCIIPNETRLRHFAAETGVNGTARCVWNCPSIREVRLAASEQQEGILRLYYHGNLSPRLLPLTVIQALAELRGAVTLTIVGYETVGTDSYLRALLTEAARMNVAHLVEVHDPAPRDKLWDRMDRCHVGLALFPKQTGDENLDNLVGASNKVFDYWARGLAVLVSDSDEWREFCVQPGYGLACDPKDATSITRALRWFIDHPSELRRSGEQASVRIATDWNYETGFEPILAAMGVISR
jgi:glycosyltransferase involved in cell wall biosynthesis